MRFKHFLLSSLAVAAAVSCDTLSPDSGNDILLQGGEIAFVARTEGTKAFTETLNSTLEANGWNCHAVMSPGGSEMFNTKLTLDGTVFRDPAKTWYFPLEGTTSFYGVYPTSLAISSTNTITYTSDYQTDVVAAKAEGIAKQDAAVAMHFTHILSQVDIQAKGSDTGADYTLQTLSITSAAGGTYNIATDAWSLNAASEKSCTLVATSIPTNAYTAVVSPMTFLPGDAKLHATWQCRTKGTTTVIGTYDVEVDITLQKGVHSTLKVILPNADASPITVTTTVAPWTGDVIDVEMRAPVNLAKASAINGSPLAAESTANCYVVRADGEYQIPLVYGNAIKDGVTNTSAFYNATASTAFEDSYGTVFNASSSPYIKDHASAKGKSVASAEVLWTQGDAQVDVVSVDSDYLTFSVSSFSPSNALIAVKDNDGTILWSWHLWLTTQNLSPETITNHDGIEFQIMPVALGWNGWTTEGSEPRSTAPYYQWGRKDPFIPVDNVPGTFTFEFSSDATQQLAHQNPTMQYFNPETGGWAKDGLNYDYYWDADNATASTDSPVVKTIYDPCPAGWNVPQKNTFTGFTKTGNNTSTTSEFKVIGSFNKGWTFKRNSSDQTGIFFPAAGNREFTSGEIYFVDDEGSFWLSVKGNDFTFYNYNNNYVYPHSSSNYSFGYSVWPSLSQD